MVLFLNLSPSRKDIKEMRNAVQKLTILTPTFNLSKLLVNLFKSLQEQTCKDFVWVVVDDGSEDDTETVVRDLACGELLFKIQFFKKKNGGKHTAINYGIAKIDTELTMIVDSDDMLAADAVETILNVHRKYGDNKKIGSYSFLRCYKNGMPVVPIEGNEFIDNYIQYRIKENHPGDMAEVFMTQILRQYPFPEFAGEKFISEDVVWIEIGKSFDTVYLNKSIYICEYLDGGLTANDKPMKFASPLGSMLRGKQLMLRQNGLMVNIKGAIIYNCYAHVNQTNEKILLESNYEKVLVMLMKPLGMLFLLIWKGR